MIFSNPSKANERLRRTAAVCYFAVVGCLESKRCCAIATIAEQGRLMPTDRELAEARITSRRLAAAT